MRVLRFLMYAIVVGCGLRAAQAAEPMLDQAQLTQLEARAEHAPAREQCFLFTQLVQSYTQIAGRQLANGEEEQATATLKRVQGLTARVHSALARDTNRLKNAEMLVHTASRSLGEYLHHASSDEMVMLVSTLKELDKVNEELLAQVFAH